MDNLEVAVNELQVAEEIARQAHAGQVEESTGEDYILHVKRVVDLVTSPEAKVVAWLHDVIEDSDIDEFALLASGIPPQLVATVSRLTRRRTETYAEYICRIKESGDPIAIEVKSADLRDHLRPNCPPTLRPRYEDACRVLGVEI